MNDYIEACSVEEHTMIIEAEETLINKDASATDKNSMGTEHKPVKRRNLTHGDEAPGPALM